MGRKWLTVLQRYERRKAAVLEAVKPGMEVNCGELAKQIGCTRNEIFEMAEGDLSDEGFNLHVADGLNGAVFERPKKLWTLHREPEE